MKGPIRTAFASDKIQRQFCRSSSIQKTRRGGGHELFFIIIILIFNSDGREIYSRVIEPDY